MAATSAAAPRWAQDPQEVDVLVVGGGPVGSLLGLELTARGVRALVVERYEVTYRERGNIRGRSLSVRSMEHLRRHGIADQVRARVTLPAAWPKAIQLTATLVGPALGVLGDHSYVAASHQAAEAGLSLPQHLLTEVLHERLDPGVLRTGWQVTDLVEGPADVLGRVLHVATGRTAAVRARYVVGADGGRSLVREVAGIDRPEGPAVGQNLSVSLWFPDAFEQLGIPPRANFIVIDEDQYTLFCPYNEHEWGYAIGPVPLDADTSTLDLDAETRRRIGRDDVRFEVIWSSPYPVRARVVSSYRAGRLFLAGDAAHLFPPYLGQNMNTGLDDAVNLGWKLAAVIRGWAGEALLDSYDPERRPIGERNADLAVNGARVMGAAQAEVARRGVPRGASAADEEARRRLGALLERSTRGQWHTDGIVLDQRYDGSPAVLGEPDVRPVGGPHEAEDDAWDPAVYRPVVRAGRRAPHVWLAEGRSLHDTFGPWFTLLDLGGRPEIVAEATRRAQDLGLPLLVRPSNEAAVSQVYGTGAVLVRPDQVVAAAWPDGSGTRPGAGPGVDAALRAVAGR